MKNHLDPQELDMAWDALVHGNPAAALPGDYLDRSVFETMTELFHPLPSASFVQELERRMLDPGVAGELQFTNGRQARSDRRVHHAVRNIGTPQWLRAAAAMAAIALLIALSAGVLVTRFRSTSPTVIPAVSDLAGQGPSTSSEAVLTPWFEQRFTPEALRAYGADHWSWVEMEQGSVNPGEPPLTPQAATAASGNALHLLAALDGQLAVTVDGAASRFSQRQPNVGTEVGPGTVVLQSGDTLLYHDATAIWNPSDARTGFVMVSFLPESIRFEPPTGATRMTVGGGPISQPLAGDDAALDLSLQQVRLQPGETFGYSISPQTILVSNSVGGLLEKQAWADGTPAGKPLKILAQEPYLLNNYGTGYFTLTNTSSNPVTITLFVAAPPGSKYFAYPDGTPVDTPFGTWVPDSAATPA